MKRLSATHYYKLYSNTSFNSQSYYWISNPFQYTHLKSFAMSGVSRHSSHSQPSGPGSQSTLRSAPQPHGGQFAEQPGDIRAEGQIQGHAGHTGAPPGRSNSQQRTSHTSHASRTSRSSSSHGSNSQVSSSSRPSRSRHPEGTRRPPPSAWDRQGGQLPPPPAEEEEEAEEGEPLPPRGRTGGSRESSGRRTQSSRADGERGRTAGSRAPTIHGRTGGFRAPSKHERSSSGRPTNSKSSRSSSMSGTTLRGAAPPAVPNGYPGSPDSGFIPARGVFVDKRRAKGNKDEKKARRASLVGRFTVGKDLAVAPAPKKNKKLSFLEHVARNV